MQIPILVYHKIDPRFEWGITRVVPHQFEQQIRWLYEQDFQTISFNQLFQYSVLPQQQKLLIITFDDAYQSIFQYAFPIMCRYGFTATVFVISQFVGKANWWDVNLGGRIFRHLHRNEIKQLIEAGWEVGSHGATHSDLRLCSAKTLVQELVTSKAQIEAWTGQSVEVLSYPFGRYNTRVIHQAQRVGYRGACTMRFGWASAVSPAFLLPRQSVYWWDSLVNFAAKIEPTFHSYMEQVKQQCVSFCSLGTVVMKTICPKKRLQF